MAQKITMTDTAFNIMSHHSSEIEFIELWKEVAQTMNIPESLQVRKKRQFYSELMLDNRFAALKDNRWDLRTRRSFDEMHDHDDLTEDSDESEESDDDNDDSLDLPKEDEAYN